jgi:YD repeat-containing protein
VASDDNVRTVRITHPSGLVGTFELSLRAHARSWVPTLCLERNGASKPPSEDLPPVYLSLSLTRKTFSGPGVEPMAWTYLYSPAYGSTEAECLAVSCVDWQAVEVTDPGSNTTRYVYSTRWGPLEGKLTRVVTGVTSPGSFGGSGLQTETTTYAEAMAAAPFPKRLGDMLEDPQSNSNRATTELIVPEVRRDIQRQDVTFTRETLTFDRFGLPEKVRRSSTLGYTTTDTTQYWPVGSVWVIGQPWKSWSGDRLVSQTEYDARVQPTRNYSFGLLVGSYTYLPNGMLGSITDPLQHVTVLSNHKRGVPQSIRFPDQTVVAPTVDDFGQVTRVTNQLGASTTYAHDVMGRMTRLAYPTNDSVAWNPVNRSFGRIGADEYGLPWGHWKQVVQTGNAMVTTLYDAYWRPRVTISEDVTDATSRSFVVKQFDEDGRVTFEAYPVPTLTSVDEALAGTRFKYDALGRRTEASQDSELGTLTVRTDYLPGFKTRVTNARGFSTTTSFQVFDTPSEDKPTRIEAPEGVTTVITRDEFGKPKSITRSGG